MNGAVRLKGQSAPRLSAAEVLSLAKVRAVNANGKSRGLFGDPNVKFSFHSYGAQFVEVTWESRSPVAVSRVVTVIDGGRMLNPRTAQNQIEGAVVMGVGMAMLEATEYDQRSGQPINNNLADYIVAVHADCPQIDMTFLDYPDFNLNPLSAREWEKSAWRCSRSDYERRPSCTNWCSCTAPASSYRGSAVTN